MKEKLKAFEKLLNIMDELREKCPWDKKQDFESLRKLTIEETYELADAVVRKDAEGIKKELGDILLHIVFYAKIGSETGDFDISDVINNINKKLIYRHPHIYGDIKVSSAMEVAENWENLKLKEGNKNRVLQGVPSSLPALIKAIRLQEKARGVGFDWEKPEQVWGKVDEEMKEFKTELFKSDNREKITAEFGDLLFSLINAARLYDIDPEIALEKTNNKFISRFNYLEEKTLLKGKSMHEMSLDEMETIWQEAKKFDDDKKKG
ncbi:MAG: nucleoside triphosphate pyrophosphohydrolase [Bacteroidota bacterium]